MIRDLLILLVLVNVACTQSAKEPVQRLGIGAASNAQCPEGGMVYTIYGDADENGSFGESDVLIDQQAVCNGVNGANGTDGAGMVYETIAASPEQCANGGSLIMMAIDIDRSGTLTLADSHHESIIACNEAPLPQLSPVKAIRACGDSMPYKELLLRLANGQVLSSLSDKASGKITRLTFLPDGTYANTDDSGCVFSLSTSSDGRTRSISWSGQIQESWSRPD